MMAGFAEFQPKTSSDARFMLVFILRRLMQAVIVMLTVAFLAFMLFQYVGDPVTSLLGQDATQEQWTSLSRCSSPSSWATQPRVNSD